MVKNFVKIITIVFLIGSFSSCQQEENAINQGVINYEISYPKPFEDKWMEKMMPSEMDMYFKNNKVNASLSFGLGMIKIGYITDNQNKELFEMLKFMRNKNFSYRNEVSANEMISELPEHTIKLLPDTKSIAGFICKKAMITVTKENETYEFDAWYTDKINLKDPNWCTPFREIKGVLLEYQVERMDVIMRFKAKHVTYKEIKDEEFKVPEKYSEITLKEMAKSLEDLKDF